MEIALSCLLPCVAIVEVVANKLAIRVLMILAGLYLCTHTTMEINLGVCYSFGASVRGT